MHKYYIVLQYLTAYSFCWCFLVIAFCIFLVQLVFCKSFSKSVTSWMVIQCRSMSLFALRHYLLYLFYVILSFFALLCYWFYVTICSMSFCVVLCRYLFYVVLKIFSNTVAYWTICFFFIICCKSFSKSIISWITIQEMTDFENDLQQMIKNIEFNKQQYSRKS